MKKLATMLVLVLVSAWLFACGGDDSTTTTPASDGAGKSAATADGSDGWTTPAANKYPLLDNQLGDPHVRYAARPSGEPALVVSEASASPGKATIQFVNPQNVVHDLVIQDPNGKTIGRTKKIKEGITSTQVVLKPGLYVVYCSLHRKQGMGGHLTVYPE